MYSMYQSLFLLMMLHGSYAPVEAQSSAMSLVSFAATTTNAPATTAATPATSITSTPSATSVVPTSSTVLQATFLYPTNQPTVNNIDTILVSYETPWQFANLTVFCETNVKDAVWAWYDAEKIQQNGVYTFAPIEANMQIPNFPVTCHMRLANFENADNEVDGGGFTMVSTGGVASTFAISTTGSGAVASNTGVSGTNAVGITTSVQTRTGTGLPSGSSGRTTFASSVATNAAGASAASSSSHPHSSHSSSSGMSSGAKAGVALGILIALAVLAAGAFFLFATRRRMHLAEEALQKSQARQASEKVQDDNILRMAGKPTVGSGGRVVVTNNRDSGDWRKFFTSRNPTPAQSVQDGGK